MGTVQMDTPGPTHRDIGAQLRRAMDEAELQPAALALAMDVSMATLYRFFRGDAAISFQQMCRAAIALDKPVEWFTLTPRAR